MLYKKRGQLFVHNGPDLLVLEQGWVSSLTGGPDLLRKEKNSFAGHSIFEKVYFSIKNIYIRPNV